MAKTILYAAASLDGKIARNNGSMDWLYALPNPNQIDYGYADFLRTIGTIIMGAKTYKEILGFGVEWPYQHIQSYVATFDKSFKTTTPDTFPLTSNIINFVKERKTNSEKDIWLVGGGQLITYFLNNDLLDTMILTIIPTIIGEGISLFPDSPKETTWKLVDVEKFETGAVNLIYDRQRI